MEGVVAELSLPQTWGGRWVCGSDLSCEAFRAVEGRQGSLVISRDHEFSQTSETCLAGYKLVL